MQNMLSNFFSPGCELLPSPRIQAWWDLFNKTRSNLACKGPLGPPHYCVEAHMFSASNHKQLPSQQSTHVLSSYANTHVRPWDVVLHLFCVVRTTAFASRHNMRYILWCRNCFALLVLPLWYYCQSFCFVMNADPSFSRSGCDF